MLKSPDAASYVASKPLESPPGSKWTYSTGTTALLVGIAADELGGCEATTKYLNERLLDPIGISTDQLINDAGGCWVGGFGANMTARDFARFGLLYLRGGEWDGDQIVPSSWVDESRVPASTKPTYGLQWWLDTERGSFMARGLFGQVIVVVPGHDLVIVTNSNAGGDPLTLIDAVLTQFGPPPTNG
jgi:CubicO group peptidase (beta-lactamase class C family)